MKETLKKRYSNDTCCVCVMMYLCVCGSVCVSLTLCLSHSHTHTILLSASHSLSLPHFPLTPTPSSIQGQDMDLSGIDVWSPDFDPTSVFDEESLKEITDFFVKNAGDKDGVIR